MSRNSPPIRPKQTNASTNDNSVRRPSSMKIRLSHSAPGNDAGRAVGNLTRKNSAGTNKKSSKKMDRRVRATRDALGDAIVELIQEKPFDTITVQHVLDRANVSRSTFYSHFSDKEDLFLSDAEDFFEMMSTALTRHGDTSNRVAPVQEFFAHLIDFRKFYTAMVASDKIRDVMELGVGHFARGIEQRLAAFPATGKLSATRRAALAHASAGSLFSLLDWWLHHGRSTTPAQMDALFHQMVWSGINPPVKPAPPSANRSVTRKPL